MDGPYLYHATTPEIAAIILREGFKDHAATVQHGMFGGDPETFEPGVWLGEIPVIHLAGEDGGYFDGRADEAWIRVEVPDDFDPRGLIFAMHEIEDWTWSGRQWLFPASTVNQWPRREFSLQDVIAYRMVVPDQRDELLTEEFLRWCIEEDGDISDPAIKTRWLDALANAKTAATVNCG